MSWGFAKARIGVITSPDAPLCRLGASVREARCDQEMTVTNASPTPPPMTNRGAPLDAAGAPGAMSSHAVSEAGRPRRGGAPHLMRDWDSPKLKGEHDVNVL